MKDGTWAPSSAVTDGHRVYAFFESSGLYTYDMAGNLLWQKHLGEKKMFADVGESANTPVLYGNRLVIAWDHQGASFVVALDARTGQDLWRADRQEVDSWSTPLVVEHAGRSQVVTTAQNRIRSYDLETGKIVWESEGLTMNPIPSPVAGYGMVFAMSGFQGSRLRAIRLADAKGDITGGNAIVWTLDRDTRTCLRPDWTRPFCTSSRATRESCRSSTRRRAGRSISCSALPKYRRSIRHRSPRRIAST